MRSLRAALIFLGAAGVAVGLMVAAVVLTSDRSTSPQVDAALVLVVGWSFIGTGLFAWWRRPHNRVGALMTAVGFTWCIGPLVNSDNPGLFLAGALLGNLPIVLLAQLLLSYPSGRLETLYSRRLVTLGYLDGVLLQVIAALFLRNPADVLPDCQGCPDNPIAITNQPDVFEVINTISALGGVTLLALMVALLVRRWRALSGTARSAITPVLLTGGLTIGLLGVLIGISTFSQRNALHQAINVAALGSFATIPFAFLFGLLRTRFSNAAAVGELIESLTDTNLRDRNIRDALAEALGDPSLQFAYWLPERGIYVDADGRQIELPAENAGRASAAVEHDDELVAAIIYDATLQDRRQLVRSAAAAAGLALHNQRLEASLRATVEELRASRARIVQASDDARRRLERNLHDGAQQHLVSMALGLRMARSKLDGNPTAAGELIDQVASELATATEELRELARGIHPAVLTDRGLPAALDVLAARCPVPVEIVAVPTDRLPEPVEAAIYYVAAEALTNVARYAHASSARVEVTLVPGLAAVTVSDDGAGGADFSAGTGLRGLNDRVAALDGRLSIVSPTGGGTIVEAVIPCGS